MTRRKKTAQETATSQDIKALAAQQKELRAKAKKLLANAGKDLRTVRHEVSVLKKAGIVSHKINARSYLPSRYMLSKIKKNVDILTGEAVPVPAPRKVRKLYTDKGLFEQRGSALIVPKEYANQKTRIRRGFVEIVRPLGMGEERRIILPFKATDMEAVATRLRDDPSLGGLKEPDELFGFRLFGHNMATIGFPDSDELADYILTRYQHLFSGKNGREAVKHFVLFRFKARDSQLSEAPREGKIYHPKKRTPQSDWYANLKREREAARKKKQREKETPDERKNRLDRQRIRSAQNRQRKWDDK
jgi:hypothetical protein